MKSILILLNLFFLTNVSFAEDGVPKEYHGTYLGISPAHVVEGLSYKESKFEVVVTAEGIYWPSLIKEKVFNIHYPNNWIIDVSESDTLGQWFEPSIESNIFALRQHKNSELAQIIFHFSEKMMGNSPVHATAILGEGMPVPLGVFVKSDPLNTKESEKLATSLYKKMRSQGFNSKSRSPSDGSWLFPINFDEAKKVFKSDNIEEKIKIIKNAGHNLWTGNAEEIDQRIELVKLALKDKHPKVVIKALDVLSLGGRVTNGVSIVVALLDDTIMHHKAHDDLVLDTAVYAAVVILSESYQYLEKILKIESKFGTKDIDTIHKISAGTIEAEDAELLEYLDKDPGPRRNWTLEHFNELHRVLNLVIADGHNIFTVEAKSQAERGLLTYPKFDTSDNVRCNQIW